MDRQRLDVIGEVVFVWLFQLITFGLIAHDAQDTKYAQLDVATFEVAFTRFGAGLMMHITMLPELRSAIAKMKFAVNHYWRFSHPGVAFFTGFAQGIMVVLVTIVNYYVIIVLSSSVYDIVFDFVALSVIAEFDNILFTNKKFSNSIAKRVLDPESDKFKDLFTIASTSSIGGKPPPPPSDANNQQQPDGPEDGKPEAPPAQNKLERIECEEWFLEWYEKLPENDAMVKKLERFRPPEHIFRDWKDLPRKLKILRIIYLFLRFLYVSFWFYFSPFFFT